MTKKKHKILICSENIPFADTILKQIKRETGLKSLTVENIDGVQLLLCHNLKEVACIVIEYVEISVHLERLFKYLSLRNKDTRIIFIGSEAGFFKENKIARSNIVDFLVKPFRVEELLLKLALSLNEYSDRWKNNIVIEGFEFDSKINTLIEMSGKKIKLTEKEVRILAYLSKSNGIVLTKESLLSAIWGYEPNLSTHTLETHIYRLRRKLETTPDKPSLIISGSGGYMLSSNSMVKGVKKCG